MPLDLSVEYQIILLGTAYPLSHIKLLQHMVSSSFQEEDVVCNGWSPEERREENRLKHCILNVLINDIATDSFQLYINDLPDNVASNVSMFADDTKIYRPITSHEVTTILYNDLDFLPCWSAKWLLNFNLHKCKVMSITKSTACNHDTADYYLKKSSMTCSTPTLCCTEEIGLVIVLDTKLSFRNHINMSIEKVNRCLGIIRSFSALDNTNFTLLFKAIVRPHLEHAATIRNPYIKGHIDDLEKVQCRATKLLQNF